MHSFPQVYGELSEGLLVHISIGRARAMLLPDSIVLNALGQYFIYEVAVGMNGGVWLKTKEIIDSIIMRNAIINSEFLNDIEIEAMIDTIANSNKIKRKTTK